MRLLVFVLLVATNNASAVMLAALSGGSPGDPHALYKINTDSPGSPSPIGQVGPADYATLASSSPDFVYTLNRDQTRLVKIDATSAGIVSHVPINFPLPIFQTRGLSFAPDGTLYAISRMRLYTVDPDQGTTVAIGNITGATAVEAIAFAADGTLYAAGSATSLSISQTLYTLDAQTAQLTLIGDMPVTDIDAMTFAEGFLYAADSERNIVADLYRIDPATAAVTNLGSTGIAALNGLATVVPLPATLPLLASTVAVLGFLGWRLNKAV